MRLFTFTTSLLLIACLTSPSARGAIVVQIEDTTLSAGQTGAIDVLISSTDGTDQLGRFSAEFAITQISGTGILNFQSSFNSADLNRQSDSEQTSTSPEYVFLNRLNAVNSFGSVTQVGGQGVTQFDRASENVLINGGPRLLARLELEHVTPALDQPAVYQVALLNSASTRFQLFDNSVVPISPSSFSNLGTVTISAVPEPSTAAFLLAGMCAATLRGRRRSGRRV